MRAQLAAPSNAIGHVIYAYLRPPEIEGPELSP